MLAGDLTHLRTFIRDVGVGRTHCCSQTLWSRVESNRMELDDGCQYASRGKACRKHTQTTAAALTALVPLQDYSHYEPLQIDLRISTTLRVDGGWRTVLDEDV